ncbi:MAG TPA: hypothetical protein VF111_13910 [Thermoanaerobaculia bacterium]
MTPAESQTYFLKRGHLQAFSEALNHAILDRELELQRPVTYYYDADVLIWLVLGFQNEPTGAATDEKIRLVHALLAAGYLGNVHVLRPHALEFYSVIRRQPEYRAPRVADGFNAKVRRYIKSRGVTTAIQGLLAELRREKDPEKRVDILLSRFREHGAETFATFALANGTWQQRLRSMGRSILRFDWSDGEDLDESLTTDDVWHFYRAIAGRRPSPDLRSVNNLADAASMAALSRMVTSRTTPVRFFTTTRGLRDLVDDRRAAELLTCPFTNTTILRSAEYYIVRACFEALRFPPPPNSTAEVVRRDTTPSFGLAELRIVSNQLSKALAATAAGDNDVDDQLTQFVEEIDVEGAPLPDVLARIEQSSFLDGIFANYPPPDRLRNVVTEIDAAWAALDDRKHEISSRLRDEIHIGAEELQKSLANELKDLEATLKLIRHLIERATKLGREEGQARVPDPMRDLGMVRWGLDPGERGSAVISDFMTTIFSADYFDNEKLTRACAVVAEHAMAPADEEFCAAACCILWTMSLFDDVEETITRFESISEDMREPMPPGFHVMRRAARVRSRAVSGNQADVMVERLRHHIKRGGAEQGRLMLGLGYVLFFIWQREQQRLSRNSGSEDQASLQKWADDSFRCGVEAARLIPDEDVLGAAFALNHQAFVGMATGNSSDEELRQLREELQKYRFDENVWNYRFADTVAMLRHRVAKRAQEQLRNTESAAERKELRDQACFALRTATETLVKSRPYYGDHEIQQHLEAIHDLQIDLACPDSRKGPPPEAED